MVAPGTLRSNHFDPKIVGEIRALRDILDGVEPENKVTKRRFESTHRALLPVRISNYTGYQGTSDSTIMIPEEKTDKEGKLAA